MIHAMEAPAKRRPTLAALVDLAVQLDRDRALLRACAASAIGRSASNMPTWRIAQCARALAWLGAVQQGESNAGPSVGGWVHAAEVVLVIIGLIVGAGAATGVFYYDGTRPVNVIHVLAVFVFLQLATVGLTLIAALPTRWMRWLPGMQALQETLWLISPGRLGALLLRRLPSRHRERVQQLLGHARAHQQTYREVQQWSILKWSQSFGVAFNVAALATAHLTDRVQ